ncbi:DNA polymerase domain-containing protein [Micropruina sonneratiae]|uniref:DNA polymerase domain-containing protein n=1 Tax=Micropruina sonneratiae TaxID=2986940 RepID=UPI002226E81D|nr:DNA primase small subunit domain-containing protein [Micropruina sp. KQZ13P-5]MCW3157803.1 ATP-dependent DNA ligase [Micropruina sp. KQZ13P-5]
MAEPPVELELDGRAVRISSPSKPYFPDMGLNKLQVAEYFLAVGPGILAALKDRPTTMERWPNGVTEASSLVGPKNPDGDAFYAKRTPKGVPDWVQQATITFPSGRTAQAVAPADLATIVWMVNLGTVRFHPWPVRVPEPDLVDQLRIDLDPQPGTDFADAVVAALELRTVLAEAGLTGFAKTSGGRGVHVFAPIEPADFIDARHATIAIGRALARRLPERVTVNWWKEERGERIFVDFNQMARDRLMTSAYSIRPTPAGRVSAPVTWDELDQVSPDDFTLLTMPARFAELGDVWAPFYATDPAPIGTALEWYAADDADGGAEMPYPPEYPKMPGEPPRVQPSKKNPANWE